MALLAGFSAPLLAQAQADPARLDDFAVSTARDDPSHVDQLSPEIDRARAPAQPRDRAIATPPAPGAPSTDLSQVSVRKQGADQAQLSHAGAVPDESHASVSSTADSRPQAVARLGGHDRCDPQLAGDALERCKRILELRAQEFNAPAAPQLSAEQQLLAEQRAEEEQQSGRSPATRLRLASRDEPDADLQSNQELAALYLAKQQQQQQPTPAGTGHPDDPQATAGDTALAQILNALQVQSTGGPPTGQ
jgi:hypothetical protein